MTKKQCYRCKSIASSKEHIPAKGFFPNSHKTNLMTVPACDKHNTKKSDSDEYARNLFTMSVGINEVGFDHGSDKTIRSISKSRKELEKYFKDAEDIIHEGEKTKKIRIDKDKLIHYLGGLGYGLYRKLFEANYEGYWYIHVDFDIPISGEASSLTDDQKRVAHALRQIEFPNYYGDNQEVFKYSYTRIKDGLLVFKIIFYEGPPIFIGEKKIFFPGENEEYIED